MKRAALFVGVNRYEDPEINPLQFAESDATELYAFFKHRAGYDDVRNLLNPDSDELLDTANEMAAGLAPDDFLLFFFAGHGVECDGRHLLLCPKTRYSRLKYHQHAVSLDLLKQETAKTGLHRAIFLDACRTCLLKGERDTAFGGLRDVKCLRELAATKPDGRGSLAIVCSCDEGQQARELHQVNQGLFSRAFLDVLDHAISNELSLPLSSALTDAIASRMKGIASICDVTTQQTPWIQCTANNDINLLGSHDRMLSPEVAPSHLSSRQAHSKADSILLLELVEADIRGLNLHATRKEQKSYLQAVPKERIVTWRRAAEHGYPEGMFLLGRQLQSSLAADKELEGIAWIKKAATCSYPPAVYELGYICEETDPITAFGWYQRAADLGLSIAQARYGYCYLKGIGIKEDHTEAVRWWRLSAENGCALGQFALGLAYLKGDGVPSNFMEAARWLIKSAEQGFVKAQSILADCYWYGRGVIQDKQQALYWYRLAADNGDAECCYSMGMAYVRGDGVDVDASLARLYLERAANAGVDAARVSLEQRFGSHRNDDMSSNVAGCWQIFVRSILRDNKLRRVMIVLGCCVFVAVIGAARDGHLIGVLVVLSLLTLFIFRLMTKLFSSVVSAVSAEESNENSLCTLMVLLHEHNIHRVFVRSAHDVLLRSPIVSCKIVSLVKGACKDKQNIVVEVAETIPVLYDGREVLLLWRRTTPGADANDITEQMIDRLEVEARIGPEKRLIWTGYWTLATKILD